MGFLEERMRNKIHIFLFVFFEVMEERGGTMGLTEVLREEIQ